MNFFDTQNPGINILPQLTTTELTFVQHIAALPYQNGDILYYNGGVLNRLGIGSTNNVLMVTGGLPAWGSVSSSGTVTSVSGSGGTTGLTLTGGPITTSGTLTLGGTLAIANGGTNQTAFTAKSGNIAGIVYFDGTSLQNDTNVSHLGYDTVTDTVYTSAINISNASTTTAKFTNTGTKGASSGAGMQGFSDDGSALVSGNRLGFYSLGGSKDAVHTTTNASIIEAFATENWSGTATGSNLVFSTTGNTTLVRNTVLTLGNDKSAVFTGTISGTQLTSTIATGTTPFVVSSTTPVANLSIGGNSATTTGLSITGGKTLTSTNTLTLSGTDSTTMTFPTTSATIARTDAAQTFTGAQTYSQVIYTNNAITASGNAATVPITSRVNTVTNNSAATLTITLTTTSAVDRQLCEVLVLDFSAVAQTITWVNTENSLATAPVLSNGSTTLPVSVLFQYNNATSKWRCIASS